MEKVRIYLGLQDIWNLSEKEYCRQGEGVHRQAGIRSTEGADSKAGKAPGGEHRRMGREKRAGDGLCSPRPKVWVVA